MDFCFEFAEAAANEDRHTRLRETLRAAAVVWNLRDLGTQAWFSSIPRGLPTGPALDFIYSLVSSRVKCEALVFPAEAGPSHRADCQVAWRINRALSPKMDLRLAHSYHVIVAREFTQTLEDNYKLMNVPQSPGPRFTDRLFAEGLFEDYLANRLESLRKRFTTRTSPTIAFQREFDDDHRSLRHAIGRYWPSSFDLVWKDPKHRPDYLEWLGSHQAAIVSAGVFPKSSRLCEAVCLGLVPVVFATEINEFPALSTRNSLWLSPTKPKLLEQEWQQRAMLLKRADLDYLNHWSPRAQAGRLMAQVKDCLHSPLSQAS